MRDRLAAEIPYLRRFARGLARDPVLADDLVQDCLERALAKERLYDPERNLRAWLYTILRNLFINRLRRERRFQSEPEESLENVPAGRVEGAQLETVLAGQVLAMAQALPTEQREILLLIAVEGLSYREAAEVVDAPMGTVMSRLSRAREALRTKMGEDAAPRIRRVK